MSRKNKTFVDLGSGEAAVILTTLGAYVLAFILAITKGQEAYGRGMLFMIGLSVTVLNRSVAGPPQGEQAFLEYSAQ